MEKEVFNSKYAIVKYDEQFKLYTIKYLPETEHMSDKEWKALMYSFQEIWHKYETKYMISDDRERKYGYAPEMQTWTLQLVVPDWAKIGLKKYVQILPADFISSLSSEQIDELGNTKFSLSFENKFVADYESAIEWLELKNSI